MNRTANQSECIWMVSYQGRDTDPANEITVGNNAEVLVTSSDNATQIETKIRDAVIADILATTGISVSSTNVFQHSMRQA